MRWLRNALSLRGKITASFTLIVVGGTVVSTLIGSRIITNALLDQARIRQRQAIEAARTIYTDQLDDLEEQLRRALESDVVAPALRAGSPDALARALARARDDAGVSFLGYLDAAQRQVVHAGRPEPAAVPQGLEAPLALALNGRILTSTEVLDEGTLRAIDPGLAAQAAIPIETDPASTTRRDQVLSRGLVLFSAVPVRRNGRTTGVLFGGVLRNGRNDIVDRVEQLLYGREKYRDRQIGTVALLLGDVWVSTNMVRASGGRAIGTVLPPDIAGPVLGEGRGWSGRTSMGGARYEASSEPIRDHSGRVVGALYVAILEAPFLAARTQVMLTFLIVCLVGLGIVFALTYLLTRTMIHPLEEMAAAAKRIAGGDLDASVNVASRDEIGELAAAFNNMLRSLKTMNQELQEWGHTLEEKVRERTDELVAVQARMAKSEKLASIGRLAAGVAHGINNPLGGILSLTMLALEDMPADHPLRDDLNTVVAQTLRCREIVKGLLDFSRQSDARAVRTDINPIVESTLGLLERQAIFDNIHTVRRLGDNLPPVLIDPGQLQEAVINLVVNAVDAMDERGKLTVETRIDERSGEVLIAIGDTGKGVPPEAMPLLFEPFFTTKKVGKGTGLGLAIVHGVVTSAGGRVEVASGPGGTTFTIRLPAAPGEAANAAASAGPNASTAIDRRTFLALAGAAPGLWRQAADVRPTGSALANPAFQPLPLGDIRPAGWLARQLRIQADGLTGHLDQFWPDVAQSQWFGGTAEGWERAPYWLDGAVPLAWLLDDKPMKGRIAGYVDFIVSHQRADGWYGPYPIDAVAKRYDMWAILLANKVLAQYHDATGDARVLGAVVRSLRAMHQGLDRTPLYGWGRFRWYEGLVSVFHAYERTREPWLLDLARKLRAQGVDFPALFEGEDVRIPTPRRGLWKWTKHVVNTAMATKAAALSWRLDRNAADQAFAMKMIEILDRYHGQVTGMFSGDECLAGRSPLQGTELCAVVEFMYSLEHLFAVFGDPVFADRLERVAFNALPAAISPDMWSHQYDQQVNQVQCTINPDHGWSTNGPESNLFGLEPNFGCCTANMHQGWPKFAAHLWMKTPDEGLVAAAWAPCRIETALRGVPVTIAVDTGYPFRDVITVIVTTPRAVRFPLLLRVPAWTSGATVRVGTASARPMKPGTLHRIEREWNGAIELTIRFPMRPSVSVRYNSAVAVERGPLVYSLQLGEEWTRVNADKPHRELPHGDFEVKPATPWNYGLVVDDRRPEDSLRFEERPIGEQPFSPSGAGMVATARGRKIPGWKITRGWAAELSPSDAAWADPGKPVSDQPVEQVTLIPYGCTNIRITEFPKVREG